LKISPHLPKLLLNIKWLPFLGHSVYVESLRLWAVTWCVHCSVCVVDLPTLCGPRWHGTSGQWNRQQDIV